MEHILKTLIHASERAACIARSCCSESSEVLLVAEKCDGEANTRFDRDFKTIADVLAQEAARADISSRFPDLSTYVRGEECPEMGGVRIKLEENIDDTVKMLSSLLPSAVAKRMAEAAHCNIQHEICDQLPQNLSDLKTADLGIWIDPIDATAEFIAGVCGEADGDRGLPCVTVLIGAYLRSTGAPVVGVINQPFFNSGKGRILWGVCYEGMHKWGGTQNVLPMPQSNIILMSGAERTDIAEKFRTSGWEVNSVPGAGHKLLKVVLGEAAAYIVSQGTTFRWDTCAPHSILRAMGGDIVSYSEHTPITYNDPMSLDTNHYCNKQGIIAFADNRMLDKILNILN